MISNTMTVIALAITLALLSDYLPPYDLARTATKRRTFKNGMTTLAAVQALLIIQLALT